MNVLRIDISTEVTRSAELITSPFLSHWKTDTGPNPPCCEMDSWVGDIILPRKNIAVGGISAGSQEKEGNVRQSRAAIQSHCKKTKFLDIWTSQMDIVSNCEENDFCKGIKTITVNDVGSVQL